ncbi:MAG: hypothetical protein NWQ65_05345 [Crocinitomicaceae bacterium]|nr:hypothetical protein [Crocinitomicaceae bacterium]
MTYVSCSTAIISVEGAATFEIGVVSVVDVEVANEVEDEDFFDEALLVAKVEDKVEALLIDKDDFDFEVDKGVVRVSDANLFGTVDLARVGTNKKYVPTIMTAPSAANIHQAKSGLRRFLSSASKRASRSCRKAGLGLSCATFWRPEKSLSNGSLTWFFMGKCY